MRPIPIPDLPEYDGTKAMTLRQAVDAGLVDPPPGRGLNPEQLGRWCRKGVSLARGGPRYRFPAFRGAKELLTTPAWCRAWREFVARVQAEDARRQGLIGVG